MIGDEELLLMHLILSQAADQLSYAMTVADGLAKRGGALNSDEINASRMLKIHGPQVINALRTLAKRCET